VSAEIVLVEDSPEDVELTLRALRRSHVANPIQVLEDGAEALDYLLDPARIRPRLILLDLSCPG
jgi:CheY-like chemotaxis protein